jgi:hypothetical protein
VRVIVDQQDAQRLATFARLPRELDRGERPGCAAAHNGDRPWLGRRPHGFVRVICERSCKSLDDQYATNSIELVEKMARNLRV